MLHIRVRSCCEVYCFSADSLQPGSIQMQLLETSPRSIAVGRMKADLGSVKMAAHSRRVNLRHKRDISVDCDWRH